MDTNNVVGKFVFMRFFSFHQYPKLVSHIVIKNLTQVSALECNTRGIVCCGCFSLGWAYSGLPQCLWWKCTDHVLDCRLTKFLKVSRQKNWIFPPLCIGTLMGRISPQLHPPIAHCASTFTCSGKKFVKKLSVLSGNNSPEALESNSRVNESNGKWL